MKHSISQLYPCSKISLGSELYYICELGKYLHSFGDILSLEGIVLEPHLDISKYYNYLQVAIMNGWVTDIPKEYKQVSSFDGLSCVSKIQNVLYSESEVVLDASERSKRNRDEEYAFVTTETRQVILNHISDDVWEFYFGKDRKADSVNIRSVGGDKVSQNLLSLVAYVAIQRFKTGVPKTFFMSLSEDMLIGSLVTADLILMLTETDALVGWCFYDGIDNAHASYEAWWSKYKDRGHFLRYYSPKEKQKFFTDLGFYVGDVVFLYERTKGQQHNAIKGIAGCNYAIIRGMDKEGLVLDVYHSTKTRYEQNQIFHNDFPKELKKMYNYDSTGFSKCRVSTKRLSWISVGVEYIMYDELFFISSIQADKQDTLEIKDITPDGEEFKRHMDCVDAVYWLLKDYSVNFDAESFKSKYFPKSKPLYDMYFE